MISKFKVLKSNAGYYIGTTYKTNVGGIDRPEYLDFPHSRVSDYFSTKEEASHLLTLISNL